jgi:hypothetical protein
MISDTTAETQQALSTDGQICTTIQQGLAGAVADATIWQDAPDWNDSVGPTMRTGSSWAGVRQALIHYDLSSVPGDATITSASLSVAHLYKENTSTISVHRVVLPWDAATVTWDSFAGSYDPMPAASMTASAGSGGFISAGVDELVQGWVSDAASNHGVLLTEPPSDDTEYKSSDSTEDASLRPKLDVCYVTCSDGIQNGDETGIDCGGGCAPCEQACGENLALSAVPAVNPGGGSVPPYSPATMNNGVGESCAGWSWMDNDSFSPGWATLTWGSLQTVGSMFIDGERATSPSCSVSGRDILTAEIQYMNASDAWVHAGFISGQENYMFVFPSLVQAKAVRIFNARSSAGNGNSMIYEWYVWSGQSCDTPVPN